MPVKIIPGTSSLGLNRMEVSSLNSMSSEIKQLLLRAWRKRWTDVEFSRHVKKLLPRGVSGDVYDLADCILKQAISGPVPNVLFLSYLNICMCTQKVSFGAVMLAISKIQDQKPQCIISLLDFIHKYRYVTLCFFC